MSLNLLRVCVPDSWGRFLLLGAILVTMGLMVKNIMQLKRMTASMSSSAAAANSLSSKYNRVSPYDIATQLLYKAYQQFGVPRKGLIHIGAHQAEELPVYKALRLPHVLWVEANPKLAKPLDERIKKHAASRLAIFAASDTNGTAELNTPLLQPNVASLLPLKEMIRINPDSKQQEKVTVQTKRLDDVLASVGQEDTYNVMVLDIQGAELQALKGAVKTLAHVDAIVTEVNYGALYEGAGLIQMLDAFLSQHGFTRVDTMTTFSNLEGDALYLKKRFTERITTPSA